MSIFSRSRPPAPLPYAPDAPAGLAARWVRWAAGIGPLRNPISDSSGLRADVHQPDDVWFLAGTFGQDVQRSCAVPAGRPLFFPAFNMWHFHADGPPPHMPRASGTLTVDTMPVELDMIATPVPFQVAGARMNPVTRTNKPITMTVWGLWKLLDPLPAGHRVVHFAGSDGYGFTVNVTYHLMVN